MKGPCPKCGGKDRFYLRVDGSWACRQCNQNGGGDLIDFHKWYHGTDIKGLTKMFSNDWQPAREEKPSKKERLPKAEPKPDNLKETYSYKNEQGKELFQVKRYEKAGCEKTFRQGHFDASGAFVSDMQGVRRALYQLPEVMAAKEVLLVEGEKDVESLRSHGFVATTSPMGASSWKTEYAESLRGKNVVIIPDNDEPGRKYEQTVTSSLVGEAASVRVVRLPGGVKDVSDWFDAGGTKEELLKLKEAAISVTEKPGGSKPRYDSAVPHNGGPNGEGDTIIDDPELWPVLDPEALHEGFVKDFVSSATEHSEADPAAVLGTFLTRLSVEVGRGPFMRVGDGVQQTNLLTAIVGPTGLGRKGTSAKPVDRLFELKDPDYLPARTTPGPLSSGEGLIDAVKDEVHSFVVDKKTKIGEWVVIHPGVDDKRLIVITEEFSSALQAMAREGNTLSSIVRQIFDSGNLEPLTKSSKTKATGAHIGIVGHITSHELIKILNDNDIHNGFFNRFLWFCSKRQKVVPFPEPIPDDKLLHFQSKLKDIIHFASQGGEFRLSENANGLWGRVYPDLSESRGGLLGAVLQRGPVLVLRLAMLHAIIDRESEISVYHIETALKIWDYCEKSARYIFGEREVKNPLEQKILTMLEPGPITMTDISNNLGRHEKSEAIRSTLKSLAERNKIAMEPQKTPGRSKVICRILK